MITGNTEALLNWDREHIIHPYTAFGDNAGLLIDEGHGVWLQDTNGREYMDMTAQLGYAILGHGRREVIDAVVKQLNKIPGYHTFFGLADEMNIECARTLAEITPSGLDHFYFCTGGSEAVDAAYKMSQLYWYLQGANKIKTVTLYGAYHGLGQVTWASTSATGILKGIGPPRAGFTYIPSYHCAHCTFGLEYPECNLRCARYLADIIEMEGPENVGAFMAEPVMGASGQIPPPPEYWPIVRKICDEYDILLIADEIQSAFTKTGKMFALENWKVKPDIMILGKAISAGYVPFAAAVISDRVFQILKDHQFRNAHTFSGHAAASAAALAAIRIYINENLCENAVNMGNYIMRRLEAEFRALPCVGGYSGIGLMIGIDMVADKQAMSPLSPAIRDTVRQKMWQNGVLGRPIAGYKNTRLFICPPCVITEEEVDKMLDLILPIIAEVRPG